MIGSVYCVLFKDGTLKAGFTAGSPHKRIRGNVQAGKSFGKSLKMVFFTEAHRGADTTEAALLERLRGRLKATTNEYFLGCTLEIAREEMLATNQLVAWADRVETVDGRMLVCASLSTEDSERSKPKIEERIVALVGKSGPGGVTEGVIKNRFRGKHVTDILNRLVDSGEIVQVVDIHPKNGTQVRRFYAA